MAHESDVICEPETRLPAFQIRHPSDHHPSGAHSRVLAVERGHWSATAADGKLWQVHLREQDVWKNIWSSRITLTSALHELA